MQDFQNICMGCMKPVESSDTVCKSCGRSLTLSQDSPCLPLRTVLKGNYLTGCVVSKTPTELIYIGKDLSNGKTVHIHEFFPERLAQRSDGKTGVTVNFGCENLYYECLNSFDGLWKSLMSLLNSQGIETAYDVFYSNETVYAVSNYIESITLRQYLDNGGSLMSFEQARAAFDGIFSSLDALHSCGIIHAGISASSIHIGADSRLHLAAPSIPQSHTGIQQVSAVPQAGYAPLECYSNDLPLSPATDIYSVMAVMYTCMTGNTPQPSPDRAKADSMVIPHRLAENMPDHAVDALIRSMKVYPQDRIQSIRELRRILSLPVSGKPQTQAAPSVFSAPSTAKTSAAQTPAAPVQSQTVQKGSEKAKEKESSSAVFIKGIACALVVAAIVFSTLYTTFLYKSIDIPVLNKVFAPFSFLPINSSVDNGPTVSVNDTQQNTVAPPTAVPTTQPPTVTPTTTLPPTTTQPPTTAAPSAEMVEVADFMSLTYSEIRANAVFNRNFRLEYEFEYSDTFEKNAVISQSIPYGESVPKGTEILLVISSGPEKVELRDVIGMDYDEAKTLLEADGFKVKKEIRENDGSETPDKVYMMSLVAGLEFEKGTEVTLVVWGERPIG